MDGAIPVQAHEIEVRVRDQDGHRGAGWASTVRADGIEVSFEGQDSPRLLLGAWVTLDMRVPDLDEPLRAHARVQRRQVGRAQRSYQFDFEPGSHHAGVPFILRSTLNRRQAVRVTSQANASTAVLTSECGVDVRAPLTDISEGGLGLKVPFPKDRLFAVGDEVSLVLESGSIRLPLRARIFHARARGADVQMGVGFVEEACNPQHLAALTDFVRRLRAPTEP